MSGGLFVNSEGKMIGEHQGFPFFTIGQRKGLGIAFGEPMYVTEIIPDTNTVVLGREEELDRNGLYTYKINLQKYEGIANGFESVTKIRYQDKGIASKLFNEGERIKVEFDAHVKAVAPGQSAVFYEGDDVIGGGIIQSSFNV